jgi:hypothetical protein
MRSISPGSIRPSSAALFSFRLSLHGYGELFLQLILSEFVPRFHRSSDGFG